MINGAYDCWMTLRVMKPVAKFATARLKPPTCAVTVNKPPTSAAPIQPAEVFNRLRICRCVATSSARFLHEGRLGLDAPPKPCAPPGCPAWAPSDTTQLRFDGVRVHQRYRLGDAGADFN